MFNLDNKNPSNTTSKALLAFKPRQVILAQHNPKTTMSVPASKEENSTKITALIPESEGTLHESILDYLHRSGFSKTLKRFQSEAQIQSDAWKASSLHLEDIFCKYNACNGDSNKNTSRKPVNVGPTNEEATTKKKKKKSSIEGEFIDQTEVAEQKIDDEQPKKKKKTKHDEEVKIDTINELKIDDSIKKTKEKKKKKSSCEDKLEGSTSNEHELVTKKEKRKKNRKSSDHEDINTVKTDTEKKSSKKRKRSLSPENDNENRKISTIIEEPKRQNTQTLKEENNRKEEINGQETSNKSEINGGQKSTKKQRNVTNEPKTVNAFQRVKADQVEYADDKLQDNSYWAKDGADIGYGAKAQEVLGQVKGRDFRHEKTKKKRGSYRGGLIDLQSHSIKFNYSDQD